MNHAEDENWYTVYIDIYQYRNEGRSSKKIKSQPTTPPLYKKTKNNKKQQQQQQQQNKIKNKQKKMKISYL